jgi:hypothetical protein
MSDERMQPLLEAWFKDREATPHDVRHSTSQVMARLPDVHQRGRWWPLPAFDRPVSTFPSRELAPAPIPVTNGRTRPRGFTMFSALKIIVAGAIVALFGGFLLAGILTTPRGDEMAPAAVTESPSPMTTEQLLSGMVTEEVEPGVLWVRNDGVSDLAYPVDPEVPYDIVAGHDGGIYVLEPGHYARLGEGGGSAQGHRGFDWSIEDGFPSDVGVAPDGTIWAVFGERLYASPWGSGYETRHLATMEGPYPVEVTSDGTVWAVWRDDQEGVVFGYLGADGWTTVGEWPFNEGYLRVSDRGEAWALDHVGWGFFGVHRFVDGAWREEEGSPPIARLTTGADVGVDGTFWGIRDLDEGRDLLFRIGGTGWMTFEPPDGSLTDLMRELAKDGWVPDDLQRSRWGEPHVAPDGSLWVPSRLGVIGGGHRSVCGPGIDGVARFDGETWSRFLQGRCVEVMDIAADGSVWLLASTSDARFPLAHVYVITPEAVAATE